MTETLENCFNTWTYGKNLNLTDDEKKKFINICFQLTGYEKNLDIYDDDIKTLLINEGFFKIDIEDVNEYYENNCHNEIFFNLDNLECVVDDVLFGLTPSEVLNRQVEYDFDCSYDKYAVWGWNDTITGIGSESDAIEYVLENTDILYYYDVDEICEKIGFHKDDLIEFTLFLVGLGF